MDILDSEAVDEETMDKVAVTSSRGEFRHSYIYSVQPSSHPGKTLPCFIESAYFAERSMSHSTAAFVQP